MTDYKRFEGETDEELIYRITGEKDKIGSSTSSTSTVIIPSSVEMIPFISQEYFLLIFEAIYIILLIL